MMTACDEILERLRKGKMKLSYFLSAIAGISQFSAINGAEEAIIGSKLWLIRLGRSRVKGQEKNSGTAKRSKTATQHDCTPAKMDKARVVSRQFLDCFPYLSSLPHTIRWHKQAMQSAIMQNFKSMGICFHIARDALHSKGTQIHSEVNSGRRRAP
jgi:hypothetical protein